MAKHEVRLLRFLRDNFQFFLELMNISPVLTRSEVLCCLGRFRSEAQSVDCDLEPFERKKVSSVHHVTCGVFAVKLLQCA